MIYWRGGDKASQRMQLELFSKSALGRTWLLPAHRWQSRVRTYPPLILPDEEARAARPSCHAAMRGIFAPDPPRTGLPVMQAPRGTEDSQVRCQGRPLETVDSQRFSNAKRRAIFEQEPTASRNWPSLRVWACGSSAHRVKGESALFLAK
jgi:hypothetical protein